MSSFSSTGTTPYFTFGAPSFGSEVDRLRYDLKIALERLEAFTVIPGIFASVLEVEKKYITVCTGPQTLSIRKPPAMKGLVVGAVVRLQAGQDKPPAVTQVVEVPPATGPIVRVVQIVDEKYVEVAVGPEKVLVLYPQDFVLHTDDRVILDFTAKVVVKNLGRGDKSKVFGEETGVTWEDIGGLDEAKKLLIEAIEEPVLHKELYARYNRRPTRGILLHGPPGNGKTLIGKAAATALAKVYGATARSGGFLYVKGPELLNMFVGNSEGNIRQLFASAREHRAVNGYPAIIFIDEADALMGKRGARRGMEGMERTLVPQFLAEMDGLEDAGCMVLLATNRPDTLDPAVVRPGRVDTKIYIRRPTQDEAVQIFSIYLKSVPIAKNTSREELATKGAEALFDDRNALLILRCKDGKDQRFGMRDLASGALIASIVDRVSQRALRRERDGQKCIGVSPSDFVSVLKELLQEYRALDHNDALTDFVEQRKLEITGFTVAT